MDQIWEVVRFWYISLFFEIIKKSEKLHFYIFFLVIFLCRRHARFILLKHVSKKTEKIEISNKNNEISSKIKISPTRNRNFKKLKQIKNKIWNICLFYSFFPRYFCEKIKISAIYDNSFRSAMGWNRPANL